MNLDGGINQYTGSGMRCGDGPEPYGRKVIFLNKNGYDAQLEVAARYFKPGQVLTVREIYVGRSSSTVEFVDLPRHSFNTVMFEDVKPSTCKVCEEKIFIDGLTADWYMDIPSDQWDEVGKDWINIRIFINFCYECGRDYRNKKGGNHHA